MEREDIKMLVAKWWEVYNDESLDFKADQNPAAVAGEDQTFSKSSIMASMPHEPPISYIPAPTAAWNIIYFEWWILIVQKLVWSVLIICFSLFFVSYSTYDILFFGYVQKNHITLLFIYSYIHDITSLAKGSIITFVLVYWRSLIMYQDFT